MDLGLDGRVYLVTGGSRGLGFAAAQALVADGARVVLSAPHEGTASSAVARLAQNAAAAEPAAWVIADNADPATPGRLIAAARDRFGRLDGALISVRGSPPGTVATTTDEAWRSAFESVFLGAVRLARILAEDLGGRRQSDGRLRHRGGRLDRLRAGLVGAGAARGTGHRQRAVPGSGRSGEDARRGTRSGRDPGQRAAAGQDSYRVRELDALQGDPDEVRARLSEHIPLRRYGEPEEFGRAAAFVLSPAASYITGAMIPVDGGAISSI
jgi:3-oxoacyl-[acyl-carrier protein] reductase